MFRKTYSTNWLDGIFIYSFIQLLPHPSRIKCIYSERLTVGRPTQLPLGLSLRCGQARGVDDLLHFKVNHSITDRA